MMSISWDEFLSMVSSAKSSHKCNLRLLDTIIVNNTEKIDLKWYYTTKNGAIAKKKDDAVSFQAIHDRFNKFALANPANRNQTVAVSVDAIDKAYYTSTDFLPYLQRINQQSIQKSLFIQVYLRPYQGVENVYIGVYSRNLKHDSEPSKRILVKRSDGSAIALEDDIQSGKYSVEDVRKQVYFVIDEIVKFMSAVKARVVTCAEMEFLLDDNVHVWLSRISQLDCSDPAVAEDSPRSSPMSSTLQMSADANPGSGGMSRAGLSSRSGSRSGSQTGSRSGMKEAADAIGRGELIIREGRKIISALGSDELPGLRAWTLVALGPEEGLTWRVNLAEYVAPPAQDPAVVALRRQRAETRHVVVQSSVPLRLLLLRGSEDLLLGRIAFPGPKAFADRWRQLLDTVRHAPLDASRASSDVTVCGNILAIIRKLESLVETDFETDANGDPLRTVDRLFSVPDGVGPGSAGEMLVGLADSRGRPMSDPVLNRSQGSAVGDPLRRGASAGTGIGIGAGGGGGSASESTLWNPSPTGQTVTLGSAGSSSRQQRLRLRAITPTIDEGEGEGDGDGGMEDDDENGGDARVTGNKQVGAAVGDGHRGTVGDNGGDEDADPDDEEGSETTATRTQSTVSMSKDSKASGGKKLSKPIPRGVVIKTKKMVEAGAFCGKDSAEKGPKKGPGKGAGKTKAAKNVSNGPMEEESFTRMMVEFSAEKARLQEELDHMQAPVQQQPPGGRGPDKRDGKGKSKPPKGDRQVRADASGPTNGGVAPAFGFGPQFGPGNGFGDGFVDGPMSSISTGPSGFGFATPGADVWAGPSGSQRSLVSRSSVVSASEQQFMKRNGQALPPPGDDADVGFDPTSFPVFGAGNNSSVGAPPNGYSQSPKKPASSSASQFKTPVELALEKQVEKLTKKLAQREEELGRTEDLYKKRGRELEAQRQSAQEDLRRLQEVHSKELLLLREGHSRELAAVASHGGQNGSGSTAGVGSTGTTMGAVKAPTEGESSKHWLAQLEAARCDFRRQQDAFATERRQMQTEFASKLEARDRQARSETAALRTQCGALEDRLSSVSEELAAASAKTDGLLKLCRQTEQARVDAVEAANKLRSDLRGVQQAVTTSYRLEASQAIPAPSDPDAVVRAAEAKLTAKEKQMDNKMEFMKAQLAAEQAAAEELRATVQTQSSRIEELREEFRQRMREAEVAKAAAVEDTERRLEVQFEARMSELTVLQAKVAMLQGQVSDAYQDGALSKQREEAARTQLGRASAQLAAVRSESDGLRAQIEELRQQRDELSQKHASQQNQDAVLRRLDNERQYLRSQLATELAHKTDLQRELTQCQALLVDTQRQWRADVDTLRASATEDTQTAAKHEQSLTEMNVQLEADASRLRTANKDLKDGFAKTRDLLRMEQLAIENLRADYDRLQDDLKAAREETLRVQEDERGISDMRQREIDALVHSMQELEARRLRDIAQMKDELAKQFMFQSSLQKDALQLRTEAEGDRRLAGKQLGTTRMLQCILRWRRNRLFSHFRTWSCAVLLMSAAEQFRDNLKRQLRRANDEAATERQHALEALRSLQRNDLEMKLAEARAEAAAQLKQALLEAAQSHEAALRKQEADMEANFADKELEWEAAVRERERQGQAAVEKEALSAKIQLGELQERCRADLAALAEDGVRKERLAREEAIKATEAEWLAKLRALEVDMDFKHTQHVAEIEVESQKQRQYAAQETARKIRERDEMAAAKLRESYIDWQEKKAKEQQDLEKSLGDNFAAKEQAYRKEQAELMATARQQAHEDCEGRIRELRAVWKDELNGALSAREQEVQQKCDSRIVEIERAGETERQRAVKMEAQKWQQAAKEMQRRFELDLNLSRDKGWEERDAASAEEMQRLEHQHSLELNTIADKNRIELEAIQKANATELEHLRNSLEAEHEEARRVAVNEMAAKKDNEWGDVLRDRLVQAEEEAKATLDSRLKQTQMQLEKFRDDVVRQGQHHAQERQELLDRIARQEDMAKRMEALNATEIDQIKRECETEKDKLKFRYDKAKERALEELMRQVDHEKEVSEARWKEECARLVETERKELQQETEAQMAQLQDESERLVTGLETALTALRKEKNALAAELEAAAAKQEAAEDHQYDLEQSLKRAKLENSLTLWRLGTSGAKLKLKFTASLKALRATAEEDTKKAVAAGLARAASLERASLRFAELVLEAESTRKKALSLLTTYKSDVLLEKRTQIRLCEREMSRLSEEREALDVQKDRLEEETEDLQHQVQEVEEQIREHHRTSAVQNGRINVTFARKKRRLDNELERIFDLIEQKREAVNKIEEQIADRSRERDEKEAEMVDAEKGLVAVLVEQQRQVLVLVDENTAQSEERARLVARIVDLPLPDGSGNGDTRDLTALRIEAQDAEMKRKALRI